MNKGKVMDRQIAHMLLDGAKRRLKAIDLCRKLLKATHPETNQAKGLTAKIRLLNIEAQELIAVSRMLWRSAQ